METVQQDSIETIDTIQRFANLAMMFDEVAQEDVDYSVEITDSATAMCTWVHIRTISQSGWVRSGATWAIRRAPSGRTTCKFLGGHRIFMGKTTKMRTRDEATRSLIHTARTDI